MKKYFSFIVIIFVVFIFFWKVFVNGLMPIPTDTIVGLYHPFRDFYAKEYPRGIPFKNFLITDPVRQQIPWKNLAIEMEKKLQLPLWNPYAFSGTPLLANFQTGAFYPLNILFLINPFSISWSLFIIIAPFLAALFSYLYLKNLKLENISSLLGATVFSFSGFSISWLEWGNILHTALWLPLILLSIDKVLDQGLKNKDRRARSIWFLIFLLSTLFSFFAGHLQIFFYVILVTTAYALFRWYQNGRQKSHLLLLTLYSLLFLAISSVQWISTLQFINLSARAVDIIDWRTAGWFIPWQNIVQFIAPDFYGNPTTLNYFGVFNYGEFIGYVGILPLMFVAYSIFKRDKITLFYWGVLIISFVFAFQNLISELPYRFSIPFISTSQPTRLLFLIDFCLSVLAAFGLNSFLKAENKKKIFYVVSVFAVIFISLWVFILNFGTNFLSADNASVSQRNLIFPTIIFAISALILLFTNFIQHNLKKPKIFLLFSSIIIIVILFDLFRFGWKYTSFAEGKYFYPNTKTIEFLKSNLGNYRILSTDARILPPNFSAFYRLQSVEGYDPLYLKRYAELMVSVKRGQPDISTPFGFNRIVRVENYDSTIVDLLGVKYVLSLSDLENPKLVKVFQEGETRVYENRNALPRAFFVKETAIAANKQEAIELLYNAPIEEVAIVEENLSKQEEWGVGKATVEQYLENKIIITTENEKEGFLVLTDSYYPSWVAKVDGQQSKIYLTDFNFRGIIVPAGKHRVVFENNLF